MNFQAKRAQHAALPPRTKLRKRQLNRHFAPQSATPLSYEWVCGAIATCAWGGFAVPGYLSRQLPYKVSGRSTAKIALNDGYAAVKVCGKGEDAALLCLLSV